MIKLFFYSAVFRYHTESSINVRSLAVLREVFG